MWKRIALIGVSVATAVVLLGSMALWALLSSWLPTKGKTLLIRELERRAPVHVSIGTMRYRPFQGLSLEEVRIVERATQEPWCHIPAVQAQVDWLALLVGRRLVFRSRAAIERPAPTVLTVSGRYRFREQSLLIDIETGEVPLRTVTAPLTRYLPPSLKDGTLRLQLRVSQTPQTPPSVTGRLEGTGVVWADPPWTLNGDLIIAGVAAPPASGGGRWTYDAKVALRHAAVEGLPVVGSIRNLEGLARLTPGRVDVRQLTGTSLGSRWTLGGTVVTEPIPSLELLLTSRANLASLATAFPTLRQDWQPDGVADLRAVCRGPLEPSPPLDCLVHADLFNATLAGSKLTHPLTDITGRVSYDLLRRDLSFEQLTGRLMQEPFTLSGEVIMKDPAELGLHVTGTLPLETTRSWLPPQNPVSGLGGVAALDLTITGSAHAPRYTGGVELRGAAVRLMNPSLSIERATGSVRLTGDGVEISRTTLSLNDEPLTLQAVIAPLERPRIVATVGFPHGQLSLTGRVTHTAALIEEARLALEKSHLLIRGTVGLGAAQPSALDLSGTLELSELTELPFVTLPSLNAWNLQGLTTVEAKFRGQFSDWPAATIEGRLRADRLSVRDLPLEQLTVTLEQGDGAFQLRIPSALCAEGKCWGELIVEHRPNTNARSYLLQADIVGLKLAKLAQAIPAWRSRSVTGSASARALVSGTWEQRSTWRGEGWLNASGERLGDVPLLDKLFRGLFGVLGDRLGLESLRQAQITQASVQWRLSQERFHTENLRFGGVAGTEPVAVYATGSLGLDRTLDLVIEPELSEGVVLQAPTTSTPASTILKAAGQLERLRRLIGRHRITGTLDKPEYRFEFTTQEIFKQLVPGTGDFLQQLLDTVR